MKYLKFFFSNISYSRFLSPCSKKHLLETENTIYFLIFLRKKRWNNEENNLAKSKLLPCGCLLDKTEVLPQHHSLYKGHTPTFFIWQKNFSFLKLVQYYYLAILGRRLFSRRVTYGPQCPPFGVSVLIRTIGTITMYFFFIRVVFLHCQILRCYHVVPT